ncbi:carboxylesterase/lipase family protein [Sphingomonas elodea]|uniref:carboxylesterase/lipase family protein n=1 Tax=Sphingomonas elodea TaxID=179878 RepID=UPI0002630458|nr:carboxylesterase family protein [Sphingomonas elodea]
MRIPARAFPLGVATLLLTAAAAPGARTTVTGGAVRGSVAADGAQVFRGIPYAAPPLDRLRWRAPQPVRPWRGERAAIEGAPACLQNDYGWNRGDATHASEDCLTLDVRTPGLTGKRPVMVWIHGGSNRAGSARGTVESRITQQGVVLVAIQYRLGIFGFLAHRGAAAEAKGHAGNYGLMDQIAALRWVRANIAAFGGDPGNVTIFGESAGSQDVSLLLAAPAARGLFARAILQSGTPGFGMPFRPLGQALALGDQAERLAGVRGIAGLRAASAATLLATDRKLHDPVIARPDSVWNDDMVWLRTQIDGAVLPRSPRALLLAAPRRPVLLGTSIAEFGPAEGALDLSRALRLGFGAHADAAAALYRAPDDRRGGPLLALSTDLIFTCPTEQLATLLAGRGWPVWRYRFDLARDGGRSSHGSELPFLFDGLAIGGQPALLQQLWTRFATTGAQAAAWPRYTPAYPLGVTFDSAGMTPGPLAVPASCRFRSAL